MTRRTSYLYFLQRVWPDFVVALRRHRARLARKRYRQRHATAIAARKKLYRATHAEQIAASDRRYRQANAEKITVRKKKYRVANTTRISQRDHIYRRQNRALINAQRRKRNATDARYRLVNNLRRRLSNALCGRSKSASTLELLGCTPEECQRHLERQFVDGMSWHNRHEWHVDHIRPIASFDLTQDADQRACFHYTNLQPLWAADNMSKGAKLEWRSSLPAISAMPASSSTRPGGKATSPAQLRRAARRTRSMSLSYCA